MRELRYLGVGVLLGVLMLLSMGQAGIRNPSGQRYQMSASIDGAGNHQVFILDHETNKLYHRTVQNNGTLFENLTHDGVTVDNLLTSPR